MAALSNAERQRRYRAKSRNGTVTSGIAAAPVTGCRCVISVLCVIRGEDQTVRDVTSCPLHNFAAQAACATELPFATAIEDEKGRS